MPACISPSYACLLSESWIRTQIEAGIEAYAESTGRIGCFRPFWTRGGGLKRLPHQQWIRGIIAFAGTTELVEAAGHADVPVVNVSANRLTVPFPSVLNDEFELGRRAAAHLIEYGAASVTYLSAAGGYIEAFRPKRREGARAACEASEAGFRVKQLPLPERGDVIEQDRKTIGNLAHWMRKQALPPSIVAEDAHAAMLAAMAADDRGLTLGRDLALIQLCDPREQREYGTDGISFVPHDWEGVGRMAAETLCAVVEEGREPPALRLVPPLPLELTPTSDSSAGRGLHLRVRSHLAHSQDYALTTREVAEAMGVSQSTLYREFQRESGHPLKHELVERRLGFACRLLRETDLPIADVSARCGYSAGHNFAAAFRRRFGVNPLAWREKRKR